MADTIIWLSSHSNPFILTSRTRKTRKLKSTFSHSLGTKCLQAISLSESQPTCTWFVESMTDARGGCAQSASAGMSDARGVPFSWVNYNGFSDLGPQAETGGGSTAVFHLLGWVFFGFSHLCRKCCPVVFKPSTWTSNTFCKLHNIPERIFYS